MNNQKWKKPNAYKHGAYFKFNRTTIVPGEDPKEFAALYNDLILEWDPEGATEEDAVLSIAKAVWRKRRAQKFLEIEMERNATNPNHPSYEEALALTFFNVVLRDKPDVAFEQFASRFLRADKIKYLKLKFLRSSFKSVQEWAKAVSNEIESVLVPETKLEDSPEGNLCYLSLSSSSFTEDFFDKELTLDERLETLIDRAVKRLIQIKGMKRMLGLTVPEQSDDKVRKITAKKASNG
jgi:hypothetical protein